jgi:hypothetical protein
MAVLSAETDIRVERNTVVTSQTPPVIAKATPPAAKLYQL